MTKETFEKAMQLQSEMGMCHSFIEQLEKVSVNPVTNMMHQQEKEIAFVTDAVEAMQDKYPENYREVVEKIMQVFARRYQIAEEKFKNLTDETANA